MIKNVYKKYSWKGDEMQKVFEKIKENIKALDKYHDGIISIYEAIKIVNKTAEEYNNDWIPIEEDKPVLYTKVLITYKTCEGEKVCEGRYNGTYWYDSDTKTKLKAIAWQPLPIKYQPKGEKE